MSPVEGGFHCNYCDSKVYDLSHLSESELANWKTLNGSKCIILNEPTSSGAGNPLSVFALALLIVAGSSFFNFADAQVESELKNLDVQVTASQDSSLGILQVHLINQHQDSIWGKVWVKLSNGKELELYEAEQGKYFVEIPAYCKGKEIVVFAEHLKKKKHTTTVMHQLGEDLEVTFTFKSKYRRKDMIVGYF